MQAWRMVSGEEKSEARPMRCEKATRAVEGAGWSDAQFSGLKSCCRNASESLDGFSASLGGKAGIDAGETEGRRAAVVTSRRWTWFIGLAEDKSLLPSVQIFGLFRQYPGLSYSH